MFEVSGQALYDPHRQLKGTDSGGTPLSKNALEVNKKEGTWWVVVPEDFICWPVGDEHSLSDPEVDLEIKALPEDGNTRIPVGAKVLTDFRQLSRPQLVTLQKYVTDRTTNKSDHENHFLGPRWVVIRRAEAPRYVAFGCNVWRLDKDQRTLDDNKNLLLQINEALKDRKHRGRKFAAWSFAAAIVVLAVAAFLWHEPLLQYVNSWKGPPHFKETPTLVELAQDGSDTGIWKFYRYHFPDVYDWLFKESGTPERQAAEQLLDPKHIRGIWKHVHSQEFLRGAPEEERAAAMCRLVLYDLFTNNQAFRDNVAANVGRTGLLNGKDIETWQKLLVFPPTNVFYLQAGDLKITQAALRKGASEHHVSLPPPDSTISKLCDKPEANLIQGRLKDATAYRPAVIKRGDAKLDDWVAAHLTTTENNRKYGSSG